MREMSAWWASQEKGEARQAKQKRTASFLKECPLEQSTSGVERPMSCFKEQR